jgi:hypothetical protein
MILVRVVGWIRADCGWSGGLLMVTVTIGAGGVAVRVRRGGDLGLVIMVSDLDVGDLGDGDLGLVIMADLVITSRVRVLVCRVRACQVSCSSWLPVMAC